MSRVPRGFVAGVRTCPFGSLLHLLGCTVCLSGFRFVGGGREFDSILTVPMKGANLVSDLELNFILLTPRKVITKM